MVQPDLYLSYLNVSYCKIFLSCLYFPNLQLSLELYVEKKTDKMGVQHYGKYFVVWESSAFKLSDMKDWQVS